MTRYANLKRNESIIALFIQGVPPKQIARRLELSSVWIVYRVARMFLVERKRQISPNQKMDSNGSTA